MSHYAALLPWPRNDYEDDAEWLLSYHKNNAINPIQQKMERDEIYGLRYTVENVDSCYTERFNLAQIVYESTGCILPRDLEHFLPALAATDRFEIQEDKSASLLICCLALQRAINQQSAKENAESTSEINTGMQVNPVSEDEENSNDELKMQIKTLRSELSQLKSNYYEASREVAEERKRYESLKNQVENERKELADLRELLFRQKNQQVDETPDASISFPYHTNRRKTKCVFVAQDKGIHTADLYKAYRQFCKDCNETPIDNENSFSRRLLRCYSDRLTKDKWRKPGQSPQWGFKGILLQPIKEVKVYNV